MDPAELIFFLTGGVALGQDYGAMPADWLTEKIWGEINRMA
jgi:dynein heavy chain